MTTRAADDFDHIRERLKKMQAEKDAALAGKPEEAAVAIPSEVASDVVDWDGLV